MKYQTKSPYNCQVHYQGRLPQYKGPEEDIIIMRIMYPEWDPGKGKEKMKDESIYIHWKK